MTNENVWTDVLLASWFNTLRELHTITDDFSNQQIDKLKCGAVYVWSETQYNTKINIALKRSYRKIIYR
jgi:hypothetical protein